MQLHYFDLLGVLDEEIPYVPWMEEDLCDDHRDRYEESYNEMLMDGGDL